MSPRAAIEISVFDPRPEVDGKLEPISLRPRSRCV